MIRLLTEAELKAQGRTADDLALARQVAEAMQRLGMLKPGGVIRQGRRDEPDAQGAG